MSTKANESRVRRLAAKSGYCVRKSRRAMSCDNEGEYCLIDASHNLIVGGSRYDWTLTDIEQFLAE